MVDECGNTTIGVELAILFRLVLFLGKVEDDLTRVDASATLVKGNLDNDRLVRETELYGGSVESRKTRSRRISHLFHEDDELHVVEARLGEVEGELGRRHDDWRWI